MALRRKKETPAPAKSSGRAIRIRMYRVGFGDCFLVSFPAGGAGGMKHMLIDCGVHSRGNIDTMNDVIANLVDVTDGKIAVVVATHHHQDHISGFGVGADQFAGVTVNEVWMPWTEDEEDREAQKLRKKQFALADTLRQHFSVAANDDAAVNHVLENFTGKPMGATSEPLGLASNEKAMNVLRSGFDGQPAMRYLRAGDRVSRPGGIAGLTVKVLGPPTDPRFLAKMDPPKGHTYLSGETSDAAVLQKPFGKQWQAADLADHFGLSDADRDKLRQNATTSLSDLAFSLDQAVNNTSLVLLLSFAGRDLLFAGDAQWGNWQSWIEGADAEEILRGICFYKVSHHGSVNATPVDALSKMLSGDLAAMVSTQSSPWESIPRLPLIEELQKKTGKRTVQSDWLPVASDKAPPPKVPVKKLPACFTPGAPDGWGKGKYLWVDYEIEV
jgi:beta-lactamase superfamily II metal-dependent hydrolase